MPHQNGWRQTRHTDCMRTNEPTQAADECLRFRWEMLRTIGCLRRESMCRPTAILIKDRNSLTRRLSHTTRNGTLRCCATRTSRQKPHPSWIEFWTCGTGPILIRLRSPHCFRGWLRDEYREGLREPVVQRTLDVGSRWRLFIFSRGFMTAAAFSRRF